MIPVVELHVWRAIRTLTLLSILTTLLMLATSSVSLLKVALAEPTPVARPTEVLSAYVSTAGSLPSQPSAPSVAVNGVRVQTYAEIVPGDRRTAQAWADGEDTRAESVAHSDRLQAESYASSGDTVIGTKTSLVATATTVPQEATDSRPTLSAVLSQANARGGPGTSYPIMQILQPGERYAITGKWNGAEGLWWQIDAGWGSAWVYDGVASITGDDSNVPVVSNFSPAPVATMVAPTATPAPTLAPTATPSPVFAYSVEMERHPEANTVSFYARIQDGQNIGGGLYLWITHNGKTYRSEPSSHLIAGMTKPSEPGSPYNDNYNVKIDFPAFIYHDVDPVGEWTVTLVDGNNQALSDTTRVQVVAGDGMKEFFLVYRKP